MVKVDISQILGRDGESQSISIAVNPLDIGESAPWFTGNVFVTGQIINVGESFRLALKLRGQATTECSRCLKILDHRIEFEVDDTVEVDDVDLVGGFLDIGDILRTALTFHQPMQPLCSESCKGLCFHCGVDRNLVECGCDQVLLDPRFAALSKLLTK